MKTAQGDRHFLINTQIKKHVKEELSGENAKTYVAEIARFHRIQASTMFHQAAEHVKNTVSLWLCETWS
jgi:hypothetical protein